MKIKVITLCSGYDSQCLALDELKKMHPDFDYDLVAWSEIDKYAIQSHNNLFPQYSDRNLGDMTKIDWQQIKDKVGEIDIMTCSFPCTDISNCGLQKGLKRDSGTRSSILWYTEAAIQAIRPKYIILENVKALISKKFISDFLEWCKIVEGYGYKNYCEILDAQDYGIPQHRERLFMVSTLCDEDYEFPEKIPLEKTLSDFLEDDVSEEFYMSDEVVKEFMRMSADFWNVNFKGSNMGLKKCRSLKQMFENGWFPSAHGEWIDSYNKTSKKDISGTIALQTFIANDRFVTIIEEYEVV